MTSSERTNHLTKRPTKTHAVVGPDLDIDLCGALCSGDRVLLESNGMRIWSRSTHPLIDDFPWEVVSNSYARNGKIHAGELVVKHQRYKQPLRLIYAQAFQVEQNHPCVFITSSPEIQSGMLFVVVQMVAFYATPTMVRQMFPEPPLSEMNSFSWDSKDQRAIVSRLFTQWHHKLKQIDDGWNYSGVNRLTVRTSARREIIQAIRQGDFEKFRGISFAELRNIWVELLWLPMLMKQADMISHDVVRTHEYRKPGGDGEGATT
jgi:hypothetical protein